MTRPPTAPDVACPAPRTARQRRAAFARRCRRLAARHGPDLADWPDGARERVCRRAARGAKAAAALDAALVEAAVLARALDGFAAAPPPPALATRMRGDAAAVLGGGSSLAAGSADAPRAGQAAPGPARARPAGAGRPSLRPAPTRRLAPAAALAASAALGLLSGWAGPEMLTAPLAALAGAPAPLDVALLEADLLPPLDLLDLPLERQ